jgi:hypothetical protein
LRRIEMTARKTVKLRTTFPGDVYRIPQDRGNFFDITAEGAEVPASAAEEVVAQARAAGVALHVVEPEEDPAPKEKEGGNG